MSGTRPFIKKHPVIVDGDMSQAVIVSEPTFLTQLTVGCYICSWVGVAPIGNIVMEISNDYEQDSYGNVVNPGTWVETYFTLNGSTVVNMAPVSGSPDGGALEFTTGAAVIRLRYLKTSGTGTLQAIINCKVC